MGPGLVEGPGSRVGGLVACGRCTVLDACCVKESVSKIQLSCPHWVGVDSNKGNVRCDPMN